MRRSHFLAGVMLSRLVFTVPEVLLLLLFARLFFGVASHGSYLAVGLLILLGAFEFAGIGLLVASRAETLEAVSGLMNLVMLPMWIASGIFFSTDRFPALLQPAIHLLPLTPLIDALRRVMLEGAGLATVGLQLATVSAWGLVTFALALRWFRWS
jgi:ABC-type polysaccharide/polyol phosphate export permease